MIPRRDPLDYQVGPGFDNHYFEGGADPRRHHVRTEAEGYTDMATSQGPWGSQDEACNPVCSCPGCGICYEAPETPTAPEAQWEQEEKAELPGSQWPLLEAAQAGMWSLLIHIT